MMINNKEERRRSTLFVCCTRPMVTMDDPDSLISKESNMVSSSHNLGSSDHDDITGRDHDHDQKAVPHRVFTREESGKRKPKKKVSRIIKAVLLFEFSLVRKVRKRKVKEHKNRDQKSATQVPNSNQEEANLRSDSDVSSSIFSNSSSAMTSSSRSLDSHPALPRCPNSRIFMDRNTFVVQRVTETLPKDIHELYDMRARVDKPGSDVGLKLLLLSLVFLVFWGKACAILCTSAWLFFGPGRSSNVKESDGGTDQ